MHKKVAQNINVKFEHMYSWNHTEESSIREWYFANLQDSEKKKNLSQWIVRYQNDCQWSVPAGSPFRYMDTNQK